MVRDKKKNKSFIVNVDLKAESSGNLRMDATSSFGQHLASLVILNEGMSYIVVPQKKYYQGKLESSALKRAIGVSLDPKLLFNLIFEQAPQTKDWSCAKDKKGYLVDCRNLKDKTVIVWKNRDASRKLVTVEHPRASIQLNFANFDPEFKPTEKTFALKVPPSFKRIR